MTFVGKVLVVVNVVLTMCIAMFAGGVYTVQQNWKKGYETKTQELSNQLNASRDEVAKVKETNKTLTKSLADMTQTKNRFEGTAGNVTATAEFNIWADPYAAARVFDTGQLQVGGHAGLVGQDLEHDPGGPLGDFGGVGKERGDAVQGAVVAGVW